MIELVSIHIPKTAGRSLLQILRMVYGEKAVSHFDQKVYPDKSSPSITQFKSAISSEVRVIHGHFSFSDISDLNNIREAKFITWLRDPVERVISNYSFFKKRIATNTEDIELQKRKDETLMEYATMENSRNRMCKFIEGLSIKDFYFIGLTEYINDDIKLLSEKLNWSSIEVPRINDNTAFKKMLQPVTETEKQKIAELNSADSELYKSVIANRNKIIN